MNADRFNSEAASKQISYADIVLLNKTDRVNSQKLDELETYIKTQKKGSRILRTKYCQVPLPLILDVGLTPIKVYQKEESHHHDHHHHHSHHLENNGFVSMSFTSDRPFDVYKFEKFLTEQMPNEVFRAKGILWFNGSELRHVFQLSGSRYEMKSDRWTDAPSNQLVFIGRNLNIELIKHLLNNCLVASIAV
jgi:G3E family GTPase